LNKVLLISINYNYNYFRNLGNSKFGPHGYYPPVQYRAIIADPNIQLSTRTSVPSTINISATPTSTIKRKLSEVDDEDELILQNISPDILNASHGSNKKTKFIVKIE
jgi:hypothetical protein